MIMVNYGESIIIKKVKDGKWTWYDTYGSNKN